MAWFVYRGDGAAVSFDPPQFKVYHDFKHGSPWTRGWTPPPLPEDGRHDVRVTFAAPGTFTLRALAHDGGAANNQDVAVTVRAAGSSCSRPRRAGDTMARIRLFAAALMVALAAAVPAAQVGGTPAAKDVPPLLRDMTPVTDELLRRPSAGDWLHWRRTSDGQGYSPLAEITRDNVHHLQSAWSWAMHPGSQVTTPVVHDGVMFLASPGGIIQALNAATGDFLWEYRDSAARRRSSVRGLSIYEDKVYLKHVGRADRGGRCADRRQGVGRPGRGPGDRVPLHRRIPDCPRQGHFRAAEQQLPRREECRHRARCADGPGALADAHDCTARRARRRQLGRRSRPVPGRAPTCGSLAPTIRIWT